MRMHRHNLFAAATIAALTLVALPAMAARGDQRPDAAEFEQSRQEQRATLIEALNLSTEQVERVTAVLEASDAKRQEILDRARAESDREARKALRDEVKQVRTDSETQLQAILSAEQFERFQQLQRERQGAGEGTKEPGAARERTGRGGRGRR